MFQAQCLQKVGTFRQIKARQGILYAFFFAYLIFLCLSFFYAYLHMPESACGVP